MYTNVLPIKKYCIYKLPKYILESYNSQKINFYLETGLSDYSTGWPNQPDYF